MTVPNISPEAELETITLKATAQASLQDAFIVTEDYLAFRRRVFSVLEEREQRLKRGLCEQKGAALIGPAGAGKSAITKKVINDYKTATDNSGGREFGNQILSVIVPGKANFRETGKAILRELGYPIQTVRDEDQLMIRISQVMRSEKIAGLHLDEIQDAGRYKTVETMKYFAKRFRNMMQDNEWPICLILTGTGECKEFLNHDDTLRRRVRPIEMSVSDVSSDGALIRNALVDFLRQTGMRDSGIVHDKEFMAILIAASARRFGIAIELVIEAIGEAMENGDSVLTVDHFADAFYARSNNDDELNPFVSADWDKIDAKMLMARWDREQEAKKRKVR